MSVGAGICLTASTRMQAKTALNSWPQWDIPLRGKPVILKPLSGGRSNRSFLLESNAGKLVLRVNGPDSLLPGATRSYESQIWQAASEQGIAPPLVHVNDQQGFLVSAYIDNNLQPDPRLNGAFVDQAFDLLSRCHKLKINAPAISYAGHIEHYWNILEVKNSLSRPSLFEQKDHMESVLESLINSGTSTGLCHHDPVGSNFVGSPKKLYLIDWEYAARGLLVMDYAALGIEWGIDDDTVVAQTGIERELLVMAKILYGYICDLWEEQNGPRVKPGVTAGTPSFRT